MKKYLIIILALLGVALLIKCSTISSAQADDGFAYPHVIRATVYTGDGITASGRRTRYGIIAGRREWMGCTAVLWDVNEDGTIGEFIGYFEVLDTGAGIDSDGDGYGDTIITGDSIDVWTEDPSGWISEHGDYVYMQLIPGVG